MPAQAQPAEGLGHAHLSAAHQLLKSIGQQIKQMLLVPLLYDQHAEFLKHSRNIFEDEVQGLSFLFSVPVQFDSAAPCHTIHYIQDRVDLHAVVHIRPAQNHAALYIEIEYKYRVRREVRLHDLPVIFHHIDSLAQLRQGPLIKIPQIPAPDSGINLSADRRLHQRLDFLYLFPVDTAELPVLLVDEIRGIPSLDQPGHLSGNADSLQDPLRGWRKPAPGGLPGPGIKRTDLHLKIHLLFAEEQVYLLFCLRHSPPHIGLFILTKAELQAHSLCRFVKRIQGLPVKGDGIRNLNIAIARHIASGH